MKLKIVFTRSTLTPAKETEMSELIAERAAQLAGSVERLKHFWDEPSRRYDMQNRFNMYYEQAIRDVLDDMDVSPSARQYLRCKPEWVA